MIASLTRLPMITSRKLVALVDPTTSQYQIDWERSGLVSGMMPATFTIAEDNKTYDLTGQVVPLMEILQILKANNIGLNNMIDLRSNPAARQQVQTVVRRAAAAQAPAPARRPPPHPRGRPIPRPLRNRRRRNAYRSWRPCVRPVRSPMTSTRPSDNRYCRISSQCRNAALLALIASQPCRGTLDGAHDDGRIGGDAGDWVARRSLTR